MSKPIKPLREILIVKTSSIGDVLHCFPVLSYLKNSFPSANVDWVVEKGIAPLLRTHPQLDKVIEVDTKTWRKNPWKTRSEIAKALSHLRQKRYDLLIDLQGNTKSAVFTLFAKSTRKVGFARKEIAEWPNLLVTNEKVSVPVGLDIRARYLQLVRGTNPSDLIDEQTKLSLNQQEESALKEIFADPKLANTRLLICFGSNWQNKRLPFSVLQEFLEKIAEQLPCSFLFCGGSAEEIEEAKKLTDHFAQRARFLGRLSFPLWQRVMAGVEGIIAMDSAALHLAATTQTRCYSLFGPSSSEIYAPKGVKYASFQGECPYGITFDKRCPKLRNCATGACLREVPAQRLVEHFLMWWTEEGAVCQTDRESPLLSR